MKETTNFGLKKPEANDFYDFETQNDNLDVIDEKLKECMEGGTAENVTYENESVEDVANVKEALDVIFDGTQPVGDSKMLDGKEAELYALLTDLANYLPLSGGKITTENDWGPLHIKNNTQNTIGITFLGADGQLGWLGFRNLDNPSFMDSTNNFRSILHTGNKPSGTYTGNGSAVPREIIIGDNVDINSLITITNVEKDTVAWVTRGGAVCANSQGNVTKLKNTVAMISRLSNTNTTTVALSTNDACLNESGVTYTYTVS